MHELPHDLIESFKATLEEVCEADLLVHVVDVSSPRFRDFHESVLNVLKEIDAINKPMITVFNKIDNTEHYKELDNLIDSFENSVFISAKTGENIRGLIHKIEEVLVPSCVEINEDIPLSRMDLVNLIHEKGQVHDIKYGAEAVHICATVPSKIVNQLKAK